MVKSVLIIAALTLGADGFAVVRPTATDRAVMRMSSDGEQSSSRRDFTANAFGLTAAVLAGNASPAFAEAIKTFDMSMPSYDKASKPKAGSDAVDGVGASSSSSEGKLGIAKGSGGGASMGYSGGGGNKKEKAKKAAKALEDQEKAEELKAEMMGKKIMNMDMPSYGSETSAKEKSMFKL